jgi:hypothetical protein
MPTWACPVLTLLLIAGDIGLARAQQPFIVDDAEVTAPAGWHLEVSNQVDWLKREARPFRWQNTLEWELDYGLLPRMELSAVLPVISLVSDGPVSRQTAVGIGDSSVALKWRFTRNPQAAHAVAGGVSVEFPTGSRRRSLGSRLVDYGLNIISQHRLRDAAILRVNGGVILAGNAQTGALGIKERGPIVTAGASFVVGLTPRLQIVAENTIFYSRKATLGGSSVGWQVGSNFTVRKGTTIDTGILSGWFDGSPRLALQLGASIDLSQ